MKLKEFKRSKSVLYYVEGEEYYTLSGYRARGFRSFSEGDNEEFQLKPHQLNTGGHKLIEYGVKREGEKLYIELVTKNNGIEAINRLRYWLRPVKLHIEEEKLVEFEI